MILFITSVINEALDKNIRVAGMFLDMIKASLLSIVYYLENMNFTD